MESVVFGGHAVCDDDILGAALLADVIVLLLSVSGHSIFNGEELTLGRLMPGKMLLEQYARAVHIMLAWSPYPR